MKVSYICFDCKYFLEYYIKYSTRFVPMRQGHCVCREMKNAEKKNVPFITECSHFKSRQLEKEQRQQSQKDVLISICERLNELIQIIEEEK